MLRADKAKNDIVLYVRRVQSEVYYIVVGECRNIGSNKTYNAATLSKEEIVDSQLYPISLSPLNCCS